MSPLVAGELSMTCVTPLGRTPRSLHLVSPDFASWVFSLCWSCLVNYSGIYCCMWSLVSLPKDSPDLGVPGRNLPWPRHQKICQHWGVCQTEGADVRYDNVSHVKPLLDFRFSVFSLELILGKSKAAWAVREKERWGKCKRKTQLRSRANSEHPLLLCRSEKCESDLSWGEVERDEGKVWKEWGGGKYWPELGMEVLVF